MKTRKERHQHDRLLAGVPDEILALGPALWPPETHNPSSAIYFPDEDVLITPGMPIWHDRQYWILHSVADQPQNPRIVLQNKISVRVVHALENVEWDRAEIIAWTPDPPPRVKRHYTPRKPRISSE